MAPERSAPLAHRRAIVRQPAPNFAVGLTTSREGPPDLGRALEQHGAYCTALERCGVELTVLPVDPRHPDSTFVEDTAIVTPRGAIITRPGAPSRAGEVDEVAAAVRGWHPQVAHITMPGTLDGGDVCDAGGHFLIGLSARTNEAGARQLAGLLGDLGYRSSLLDIRGSLRLLHLKTGMAYLGDGRLVVSADMPRFPALAPYELVAVDDDERYAANCLRVNDRVLIAAGYPRIAQRLGALGYETVPLEMSEFRKMDGGLSCLSLLGHPLLMSDPG